MKPPGALLVPFRGSLACWPQDSSARAQRAHGQDETTAPLVTGTEATSHEGQKGEGDRRHQAFTLGWRWKEVIISPSFLPAKKSHSF